MKKKKLIMIAVMLIIIVGAYFAYAGYLSHGGNGVKNLPPNAVIRVSNATVTIDKSTGYAEVEFDGSESSDPEGISLNFYWDFGDGNTSVGESIVSHYYVKEGEYTVTLNVTDGEKWDSDFVVITVNGYTPNVTMEVKTTEYGYSVSFLSIDRKVPASEVHYWVLDGETNETIVDGRASETNLVDVVVYIDGNGDENLTVHDQFEIRTVGPSTPQIEDGDMFRLTYEPNGNELMGEIVLK